MSAKRRARRTPSVRSALQRKARAGFRGYPLATVAYYGPDDQFASKVAVGILLKEDGELAALERWFSQDRDVRNDAEISRQIAEFSARHKVRSVAMADRIIGCPHEEGIDYPIGESCPQCPYWADRDRWTGKPTTAYDREPNDGD